ncbi:hypothetical protein GM415_09900 [Pseudodesulfovibrio cashew]|uniref:Uncharacterized protein n=1 Tax=Pseudodesulfovibrio cashew TaxID=2678688 RepID=A0A6I6JCB8_9BACT|nr:hypothetical protein [Pseudodesulfovibrio cashew]QGY40426.1 hypothetical protein GM415_09900 [Pseudodesulfovibrio cashew]
MFVSTNTPSSVPVAACAPFAGLGHAMDAVVAVVRCLCPRWKESAVAARMPFQPVGAYGYALQCRLGRETRAG